jgi:hypothetical protein
MGQINIQISIQSNFINSHAILVLVWPCRPQELNKLSCKLTLANNLVPRACDPREGMRGSGIICCRKPGILAKIELRIPFQRPIRFLPETDYPRASRSFPRIAGSGNEIGLPTPINSHRLTSLVPRLQLRRAGSDATNQSTWGRGCRLTRFLRRNETRWECMKVYNHVILVKCSLAFLNSFPTLSKTH